MPSRKPCPDWDSEGVRAIRLFFVASLGDWLWGLRLRCTGPVPLCILYVLCADLLEDDEFCLCKISRKLICGISESCSLPVISSGAVLHAASILT